MNIEDKLAEVSHHKAVQAKGSETQPEHDTGGDSWGSPKQPEPREAVGERVQFSGGVEVAGASRDLAYTGWRGVLNRTFGFFNFARTDEELELDRWRQVMNNVIHPAKVVGVVSGNGSTGKSTVVQMIGSTLAKRRAGDAGVCAVDIDVSSILDTRMRPVHDKDDRQSVASFAEAVQAGKVNEKNTADSFMITNRDGFNVLPGVSHTGDDKLTASQLRDVLFKLYDYQKLIFLDFPGAREVELAETARGWLDAMIMVIDTNASSLAASYHMLEQLKRDHPALLDHTIILLNNRTGGEILPDMQEAKSKLAGLINVSEDAGRIFFVDNDAHMFESAALERSKCEESTQRRFEEIAAALMGVMNLRDEAKFVKASRD